MITQTSRDALARVDKTQWYGRILSLMRKKNRTWCITEIAKALGNAQHSTVSARLNEMRSLGWIESAGTRPSEVTGVTSMVYRMK